MRGKLSRCFSDLEKLFVDADEQKKSTFHTILNEIKTTIKLNYIKRESIPKRKSSTDDDDDDKKPKFARLHSKEKGIFLDELHKSRRSSIEEIFQDQNNLTSTLNQYVLNGVNSSKAFAKNISILEKEEQIKSLYELGKRVKQIGKILNSLVSLTSVLNFDNVINHISEQLQNTIGVKSANLYLYNEKINRLVRLSSFQRFEEASGLVGYCARNVKIINLTHPISDERYVASIDSPDGSILQNLFCYPIDVPISDETIVISLADKIGEEFTIEDEFLLKLFANQIISVLKNAQLYREKRKQTERVSALLEISQLLTSQLEYDAVVNIIMSKAKLLVNADRCTFYQVNYETKELIARRCDGMKELRIPIDSGIAGDVVSTKKAQNVPNVRVNPKFNSQVDSLTGYQTNCLLAVPIFSQSKEGKVIAVVQMINKSDGKTFDEEDMHLLQSFVTFATISLNNAHLFQTSKKNEEKAVRLLTMFKTLSSTLEIESVLATITNQARELLDADRASVFIVDHEKQEIWSTFADGHKCIIRIPISSGIAGYVARTGELLNIPDVYNDSRFNQDIDKKSGYRTRSILCMPIVNTSGIVIGVTEMINKKSGGSFNREDEELLRDFSNDAGISLQNSQLYEQLKKNERKYHPEAGDSSNYIIQRANFDLDTINIENSNIGYDNPKFWESLEATLNITKISEDLMKLLNATRYELYLLDRDKNSLRKIITNPNDDIPTKNVDLVKECLQTSNILYGVEDQVHIMCVPLIPSGNTIGAMKIYSDYPYDHDTKPFIIENSYKLASIMIRQYFTKPFEKEDEEILALFSLQASIAIENSQLYQKSAKMQNYLQAVLNSIDSFVFSVDITGKFVRSNHLIEKLLGIPSHILLNRHFLEWRNFSKKENEKFFTDFQFSFENSKPICNPSFEYFQSDTESIIIRYSIVPLKDEEDIKTGSVVVIEDLSLTRKLFQSLTALESGSLALISPDFSYTHKTLDVLSDIRKISSGNRVLLLMNNQITYYIDIQHQLYIPDNQSLFESLSVNYNTSILQRVTESNNYLFEDCDQFGTVYVAPLLCGNEILGILYVDGLHFVSDESRRIFQSLGSLIVIYMVMANKLSLEIEKRVLTSKTEKLEKSNLQLTQLRDKAQQSEQAKAVFLMNMSHELRTPLNAVLGFTEILLNDTVLDKKQRKFTKIIQHSGKSLSAIIGNILDLSKIEADGLAVEKILFDLRATVEDAVEMIAENIDKKNILLTLDMHPDMPYMLNGDPLRLRQVISHLLSNACKFTHNGCIALRITEKDIGNDHYNLQNRKSLIHSSFEKLPLNNRQQFNSNSETKTFLFEVIDNGIGIGESDRNKLFLPFSQGDSSTTKKYEGTGLGLVICKRLVELMNGDIGIQSELGVGTTVWFTAEFEIQNINRSINLTEEKQFLSGLNILIISPYAEITNSIQSILGFYNLTIYSFQSIDEFELFDVTISFVRAILDQSVVCDFFHKFDRNSAPFINAKFISVVPLNHRNKEKHKNVDYLLPTPFKLNLLLNYFVTSDCNSNPPLTPLNSLPVTSISPPIINCDLSQSSPPEIDKKLIKILIAEDNLVNQKLLLRQLKKVGYDADAASNGREAVEMAQQYQYHLILMDCHMPEMDGYEATMKIRELEVKRTVSIVALTADAMQGTRDRCLAAGMDDYYTKPLKQQDIEDITSKFLDPQQLLNNFNN